MSKTRGAAAVSRVAIKGIDLDIPSREFLCLFGPSGCGKPTPLNLMANFEVVNTGAR
ncbi:hypothetical protein [Bradyrhizobium sp. 187]|uniref:hypothetical protein n=1 Tax=Bradyrhizobium sp. 187 TaxID=2782655 RepID=UPI002000585E|nr:hypothetical protein [Bradyrhizobium sp. 187]UPJ71905.1 hypothetical protein IVB19_30635 [Bradyrhizobium sp. 187]